MEFKVGPKIKENFIFGLVAQLGEQVKLKAGPKIKENLISGLVAQLGERSVRIREVEGSNPFESTRKAVKSEDFTVFCNF